MHIHCRSEPARDGLKGTAFIQDERVIVDVHREQARSYRVIVYQWAVL
jgi:hypothetical protein